MPDIAKNTGIFVTSDHGDFSGDYHLVEKWPGGMDDILTRVPLIGRIPGGAKGNVVEAPVNVFDLFYTLTDMAKVRLEYCVWPYPYCMQCLPRSTSSSGMPIMRIMPDACHQV